MGEPIRLAVRAITEFLLQSGSLDNRFGGTDRATLGSRIHRKLQKEAGAGYQSEVALSLPIHYMEEDYLLEGRADGVFVEDDLLTVDEIKTTGVPLSIITEDFDAAHWGQALCYAHILAVTRNLQRVAVRLTYYHIDTGETKRFHREETAESLLSFIHKLLGEYRKWAVFQTTWKETRTASIKDMAFPFAQYRAGQRKLSVVVYHMIQERGRLFCQAPTGIGKTISTLFPSIKAMGEGLADRIFYLTAKTITRQAAEDAYMLLRQGGLRIKTVTLTAKDKICFLEERNCNPDACPFANGYYDRARDAVYALLNSEDHFTRACVEKTARTYTICPFELSLDLSTWCDGIICDYNYLFDPIAYLQRFFGDKGGDYIFLIDEAHNLVDRARAMYSAVLVKSDILALKNAFGKGKSEIHKSLREVNAQLIEVRKRCEEQGFLAEAEPNEALGKAVTRLFSALSLWLETHKEPTPLRTQALELFFGVSFFLNILELYDEHYCSFYTANRTDTTAKLLCMDPSVLLDERLSKGKSTIFFSATLSPLDYYRDVLGGGSTAKRLGLASPFPQENLCLLCAGQINTKYKERENSLVPIAKLLHELVAAKLGNYLVYFPSYRYLQDVYGVFCEQYPDIDTIVQTSGMEETVREEFLLRFDSENERSLLGFCVMGGVFAEGVDLKGDRLIGTAVVGVGLPQIGPELDYMRDYFNRQCNMGFEYIYRYPGMNKVLQAAGRVIRGEHDKGVVLLIDSRFPTASYQCLFPQHWGHWQSVRDSAELSGKLFKFWGGVAGGNALDSSE